jgi:hypothetical protein
MPGPTVLDLLLAQNISSFGVFLSSNSRLFMTNPLLHASLIGQGTALDCDNDQEPHFDWQTKISLILSALPPILVFRSQFVNLIAGSHVTLGMCQDWNIFLSEIQTALITLSPTRFSILGLPSTSSQALSTATCEDPAVASRLVSSLLEALSSERSYGQILNCGAHNYTIRKCSQSSSVVVCADCVDPCSTLFTPPVLMASCLEEFAMPSLGEMLRIVTVDFDYRSLPPTIVSLSVASATNSSLVLAVEMEKIDGFLVCNSYLTDSQFQLESVDILRYTGVMVSISVTEVFVVFSNLLPASSYDIYCASVSSSNVPSTLEKAIATKIIGMTQCCRSVSVTLAKTSFSPIRDQVSAIKISVDLKSSLPTDLQLLLQYRTSSGTLSSSIFTPNLITFTKSSRRSMEAAYLRSTPGNYILEIQLLGSSSTQYSVSYPNGNTFTVLEMAASPNPPVCLTAFFSDNGGSIIFTFDIPTNRGQLPQNFQCTLLLLLSPSFSSRNCYWMDDQNLLMFTNSDADPTIGSPVTLLSQRLKAACAPVGINCSSWKSNSEQILTIQKPKNPISPTVQLIAPSTIGPCTSFPVDLTGSGGSGGRSWKSLSVSSTSSSLNITDLQVFLSSQISARNISLPFEIPAALLSIDTAYTLSFVLCNFLESCSRLSRQFVVANSNSVPLVWLNSKVFRTMKTSSVLTLSGEASVFDCAGVSSTASLEYSWVVRVNGLTVNVLSTSVNPKVFQLPPYSLAVGKLYSVSFVAKSIISRQSAASSITVFIESGDIHALIEGSVSFGMPLDGYHVIDASSSYDEDQKGLFGVAAGLSFEFSCAQIEPFYQSPCSLSEHLNSPSMLNVSVPTPRNITDYLQAVFQIDLHVFDSSKLRTDSAYVRITILAPSSPSVFLSSLSGRKINPQAKLKLIGSISNSPCVASWSVSDSTISLSSISLSPLNRVVLLPDTTTTNISLVLSPFSLPQQSVLTFSLRCSTSSGLVASSSIDIETNSPPLPGRLTTVPKEGISFDTLFLVSALQWEDVDLPITYEFSQEHLGSFLVFRSRMEKTFVKNKFSAGDGESNLSIRLRVFDVLDAVSSVFDSIFLQQVSMSSSQLQDYLSSALSQSNGDTDSMKSALAATSAGIDSIDCNGVTWCQVLNRENCSLESYTCGECLDGFVGESGFKNTVCHGQSLVGIKTSRRLSGMNCTQDSDCDEDSFEYCDRDLGACAYVQQLCPRNCSGHGSCHFLSMYNLSMILPRCSILDDCLATCVCSPDYAGVACEKSQADFVLYQDTKHLMAESLYNITTLENPSRDSIVNWIATLASLSYQQTNLREETQELLVSVVLHILKLIESDPTSYSSEDVRGLVSVLDLALFLPESVSTEVRSLFQQFILGDMTVGQYSVQMKSSISQFLVYSANNFENQTEWDIPSQSFESLRHVFFPKVFISNSSANSYKALLSQSKAPSSLTNASVTSSVTLMFDSHPCSVADLATGTSCSLNIVLPLIRSNYQHLDDNPPETKIFSCSYGILQNQTHFCHSGVNVTTYCNGSAGEITLTCPTRQEVMLCTTGNSFSDLTSLFEDSSSCQYQSSTGTEVTCVCSFDGAANRRLQSANSTKGTIATELIVVGTTVLSDFVTTWSSAADLSPGSVLKGWKVLTTLSSLGVLFVIAIAVAHYLDYSSVRKMETELNLEQARLKISRRSVTSHLASPPRTPSRTESVKKKRQSAITAAVQHEFDFLEQTLPAALRSEPMWNKVVNEVRTYHRYIGIIFYHSPHFSRVLRIVAVGTNILIVLFVEAVTYNITDPNDGSCEHFQTSERCLRDPSPLDSSKSKCVWDAKEGSCQYRDLNESLARVISIAIMCALVSAPIALFTQLVVFRVLSQPSNSRRSKIDRNESLVSRLSSLLPQLSGSVGTGRSSQSLQSEDVLKSYRELTSEMRVFRSDLSVAERTEFDDAWGLELNRTDSLHRSSTVSNLTNSIWIQVGLTARSPEENLLLDLTKVMKVTLQETEFFSGPTLTQPEKNRRLMLLFMKDLLPGLQGQILEAKDKRQSPKVITVPDSLKALCWLFLFFLDLGCLFYIYLFSIQQTEARQNAWFQSFIIWICFDIAVASTVVVLVLHVWIPMVAMKDVVKLKSKLVTDLMVFKQGKGLSSTHPLSTSPHTSAATTPFNAAKYLFTSYRIASLHPSLPLSALILQFITPWPKRSYKVASKDIRGSYQNKFSFVFQAGTRILIYVLRSLIVLPESLQDSVVHIVSTSALGYSMLLFVILYRISPLVVLVPTTLRHSHHRAFLPLLQRPGIEVEEERGLPRC